MAGTPPHDQQLRRVVLMISESANVPEMAVSGRPRSEGSASPLTARRYEIGCWLVIEAQGEVDLVTVPQLGELVDGVSSHIVFDLSGVTFMDARGLGLLATTRASLNGAHGSVRVAGPTAQTRRLLALTALDQHIDVYDSLGDALSGHASCS